jgi:hypothetical protein
MKDFEGFKINVLLRRGWSERSEVRLYGSYEELYEMRITDILSGKEANDAIGKAGVDIQDCGFSNVCGNGDAESPFWPKATLSQALFAIRLRERGYSPL